MRTGSTNETFRVFLAILAFTFLTGCRIPGASFGGEALQLRFGAATQAAIVADADAQLPVHRRTSEARPVILAKSP